MRTVVYVLTAVIALPMLVLIYYIRTHEPQLHRQSSQYLSSSMGMDDVAKLKAVVKLIDVNHPENDAKRSLWKGDCAFLAICWEPCLIVGLFERDQKKIENYIGMCGSRIVDGTSDVIKSKEHEELQGAVNRYAIKYNQYLYDYLDTHRNSLSRYYIEGVSSLKDAFRKAMEP